MAVQMEMPAYTAGQMARWIYVTRVNDIAAMSNLSRKSRLALQEAYDVIGDPEKRKKYDQYGEQWREADQFHSGGGDFHGGGSSFDGFDFSSFTGGGFSSFFENLFGRRGSGASGFASGFSNQKSQPRESQAQMSIDMYTALLGGDGMVSLGNGEKLRLKVKPGTQPGQKVRLRGKGQGGCDLILTYQVTLPIKLTERQQELLRQMQLAQ